jgi:hypothetical protein
MTRRSLLPALVLVTLAGCATRSTAPQAVVVLAPDATSPVAAVQRFEWVFDHSSLETVAGLLTEDFLFGSTATDPTGSTDRWAKDRDSTLLALRAMFDGVRGHGLPAVVSLELDRNLVAIDDPRPGRSPSHHQLVFARTSLRIEDLEAGVQRLDGSLVFVLTRGDSAAIPPDQGAGSDPGRWWIERIEELIPVTLDSTPGPAVRWGDVLARYLRRVPRSSGT